jgi:hypothetical protein
MISRSNIVRPIAYNICRFNHCSGLFDDLCQIGELTADRLAHRSSSYIAKAVRRAMLKAVPKRQPESLRDCDFPMTRDIELRPEFYIEELSASKQERQMFTDHYINNISVNQIAKTNKMSVTAVYRILLRLRKDFANVI